MSRRSKRILVLVTLGVLLVWLVWLALQPSAEHDADPDRLARMLGSEDADARGRGLAGLRVLGAPAREHLPEIIKLGMDPSERVRFEVVLTLEAVYREDDEDSDAMLQHIALCDDRRENRLAAHRAMDAVGGWAPMGQLRKAMSDPELRKQIEDGVVKTQGPVARDAIEAAERELKNEPPLYQIDAAVVLAVFGERGLAAALRLLADCLDTSDWRDRADAARAVDMIGPPAKPLSALLDRIAADEDEREEVRRAARDAMLSVRRE